jgi:tetratricopeptide (TPR) repeat protein
MRRFTVAFLSFICSCACSFAQVGAPADIPKQLQITVRVTYENDRGLPANLRVVLASAYGSIVDTRVTDGYGVVTFSHVQPARYKITVSGFGIQTTDTGEIDLTDSVPNSTQYVRVKKIEGATAATGETSVADQNVPKDARKAFEKGMNSLEHKDWDGARQRFDEALAIYPKYAIAKNGLAMSYLNLGQGEKAVETFRAALELDAHLPQANLYLAHFYYDNKKYKEAEPYMVKAEAADPQSAQILTALANCQLRNGELDQALTSARKVHSLKDHNKFAVSHLVAADVLTSRNQNKEAAQEYELFLKEDPKSPLAPTVRQALTKLQAASN